uniref:BON domain-containing protein n=1 Tax=Campylobacter fetus TaxID=196 RepID=UPI003AF801C9
MKYIFLIFLALMFSGCLTTIGTGMNANTIYNVYSVSQDERGIYSIIRDKVIKTKIQAKIASTKNLSNFDIDVESFWGEVLLIGEVDNVEQKLELVDIAKNSSGVRKIKTYIRLKSDRGCSSSDEIAILAQLKKELFSDSLINGTNIGVSVVQCDVVFSGVVDKIEQEKRAIWYAIHTKNVREIYSFLIVLE